MAGYFILTEPAPDLESRIHQRRTELIATLGELKADLRLATTEVRDRMKARLSELARIIKLGVVDSWTKPRRHREAQARALAR